MASVISNRKANAVLDTITIVVVLTVMAISSLFGFMLMDEFNTEVQTSTTINFTNETKNMTQTMTTQYPDLMDNAFLFAFILLIIGVIVSVFMLDTHPIFFFINIVLLIFVFVIVGFLANTYDDLASDASLSTYAGQLPFTTWVITHFIEVSVAAAFIVIIALFIKLKNT